MNEEGRKGGEIANRETERGRVGVGGFRGVGEGGGLVVAMFAFCGLWLFFVVLRCFVFLCFCVLWLVLKVKSNIAGRLMK